MNELKPYLRIAGILRDQIARGDYGPGHQLPSASVLAARHGVARQTVQNVMNVLRAEGLVAARQGAGWFVTPPRLVYYASVIGSRAVRLEGGRQIDTFAQQLGPQGAETHQDCTIETPPATAEIAGLLGVEVGVPVAVRRRVMYANGKPHQLGDSYYPLGIVGASKLMHPDGVPEGDDQVLEDLGHIPAWYRDRVTCRMPIPGEVRDLDIPEGVPVMRSVRVTTDRQGLPIEVYVMILPGDRHELEYTVSAE